MILGMKNATNGLARAKGKSQRIGYGDGLIRLDRPGGASSWVCRVQKHGNRRVMMEDWANFCEGKKR